jgi:hypothetical protein
MQLLGATVVPVTHGLQTLKEAVDSALEAEAARYGAFLGLPADVRLVESPRRAG